MIHLDRKMCDSVLLEHSIWRMCEKGEGGGSGTKSSHHDWDKRRARELSLIRMIPVLRRRPPEDPADDSVQGPVRVPFRIPLGFRSGFIALQGAGSL